MVFPNKWHQSHYLGSVLWRKYVWHKVDKSKQVSCQKIDGKVNFTLWQRRMKDILVQQGLAQVKEKDDLEKMMDDKWEELKEKCVSTIRL